MALGRRLSKFIFIIAFASSLAGGAKNITIEVPDGTKTQKGLICYPSTWKTILAFYVGNYFAHAATVRSYPGAPTSAVITRIILSLFFPAGAAFQGVRKFREFAILGKSPLEKAARAGALCTVGRAFHTWKQVPGQYLVPEETAGSERHTLGSIIYRARSPVFYELEDSGLSIHGSYNLPKGYTLCSVSSEDVVSMLEEGGEAAERLACSYSFSKAVVAVVQLALSISTLIATKGNQIDRYGCAAFGLTVAPYAIGSFTNLLSGLVTPEYSCLYMVRSGSMREAESIPGCFFDGVVGKIEPFEPRAREQPSNNPPSTDAVTSHENEPEISEQPVAQQNQERSNIEAADEVSPEKPVPTATSRLKSYTDKLSSRMSRFGQLLVFYAGYWISMFFWWLTVPILLGGPYIIVGALSGFRRGQSTNHQMMWTMGWLTSGQVVGIYSWLFGRNYRSFMAGKRISQRGIIDSRGVFDYIALRLPPKLVFALTAALSPKLVLAFIVALTFFAIGGFVVVGKMLMEYGDCHAIG